MTLALFTSEILYIVNFDIGSIYEIGTFIG